jgi:1-acyl-sn-glycerol-3-phosphate acyltransferase
LSREEDFSYSRVEPWLYFSLMPVHRLMLRLYFGPIAIQGEENISIQGPVVLAVKHFSRWDPMLLALLKRRPLRFMTNANQFEGLQGWFIERLGAFPVELSRPQLSSLRHTVELLQQGEPLVIFPEGGIVRDRPLRSLKPGLARLVIQAENTAPERLTVPIVPVAIGYQPAAQLRARVNIQIGSPLYVKDYRQQHDKETAQVLTQVLEAALLEQLLRLPKVAGADS